MDEQRFKWEPLEKWPMSWNEREDVARKISELLAEHAATVEDMYDIFQKVRQNLVVCPWVEKKQTGTYAIKLPNPPPDGDGIRD